MSIKHTIHNVLHANELERRAKKAEKRTKVAMVAGGISSASIAVGSLVGNIIWRKRFNAKLQELKNQIPKEQPNTDNIYEDGSTFDEVEFEEVTENAD